MIKFENRQDVLPGMGAVNAEVVTMLRRRAKRAGSAMRWNRNTLMASYAVLAATVVLALRLQEEMIIAPTAIFGLVLIWAFSSLQTKKMEEESLGDEIRAYRELLSQKPGVDEGPEPESSGAQELQSPLSGRELEVLSHIARGESNKQAALELYISEQTVKNHIKHIFTKLDVGDRTSAILLAMRNGWIESDSAGARWRKSWSGENPPQTKPS